MEIPKDELELNCFY